MKFKCKECIKLDRREKNKYLKKSLKEMYKFEKWDLYFVNEKINKIKGTFVLYVVNNSPTFENWIEEENKDSIYTNGFFRTEWRDNNK